MDEKRTYSGFSIPSRDMLPARESLVRPKPVEVSFDDSGFAEVEIDTRVGVVHTGRFVPPPQPIGPRTVDPTRERFYNMRSLASGNPFGRNDAVLFYKQARFMEDFKDDYAAHAPFAMYYPYYQHMGYEQLRTYFTWRTKVRGGEIAPTSFSYVFLYIYELLGCIGAASPEAALDALVALWLVYREHESSLDGYIPRWIKDFHIYYGLSDSINEFVRERGLAAYFGDLILFDAGAGDALEVWNAVSGYNVAKSRFYESNADMLRECFFVVIGAVRELCAGNGKRAESLFHHMGTNLQWYPFSRALFCDWLDQPDRRVELPDGEVYSVTNNRWTASVLIQYSGRKELIGYIIKKTEACLREAVGFKYRIIADSKAAKQQLRGKGITAAELDGAIERAVAQYRRAATRTVVTVDLGNLERIRGEASDTRDKLIVPEDEPQALAVPEPQAYSEPSPAGGRWSGLRDALSGTEREALAVLLRGGDAKAFAAERGIMPEVLADSINEKAADFVGDNMIEFDIDMVLYDDYIGEIKKMLGMEGMTGNG